MDSSLLVVLIFLVIIKESCQGPHEKRLLNHLLSTYNTLERPVANESEPLEVKFGLTLQQIIDVEWNDYNLRWNDTEYGNVKDLRITPNKLWKPDVLMYNRQRTHCNVGTLTCNTVDYAFRTSSSIFCSS